MRSPRIPRDAREPRSPRATRAGRSAASAVPRRPRPTPKVGEVWRYAALEDLEPSEIAANRFIVSAVTETEVTYYHPAAASETRPLAEFIAEFEPCPDSRP